MDELYAFLSQYRSEHDERLAILEAAQIDVGFIEHDLGHIQQALSNIEEGIQSGTMTQERALEIVAEVCNRLDQYGATLHQLTE